jgi:hypothetical protein
MNTIANILTALIVLLMLVSGLMFAAANQPGAVMMPFLAVVMIGLRFASYYAHK